MKRLITVILTLLLLTSCTQTDILREHHINKETQTTNVTQQPSTPSYDKFVYRLADDKLDWNAIGMPLKVNLTSGKTTTACIDPLCMHDTEDCPFYDCAGSLIDGEILFFRRGRQYRNENGYTGTEKLCTYHVATGKIQVLEEYTDSLVFLGAFEDVLYYYTAEWAKEDDGLACTYHLHRADGKTGKVTELSLPETYRTVGGYTDSRDYPNILMIDGETIYWYKYAEDMTVSFYASDPDAAGWQKIEDGVRTFDNIYHNGYGYSVGADMEMIDPDAGLTKENFTYSYYLVRRKLGDNAPERIADNIGSSNFIVTDRYVFYMEGLEPASDALTGKADPYAFGSSPSMEILHGCRIWRMNHDGSGKTPVAETSDYFFAGKQYVHDEVLFGYYEDDENTWLAFFFMEQDENGELVLSEDTLILNTETGEFTVSDYKK